MRSSFYIFEFLEIIPPFPGRGIISTPVTPCLGPRYRTSRENAILVTTDKPFLPFTPPPFLRLETAIDWAATANPSAIRSIWPFALDGWTDGRNSAVQYRKVDVAILFPTPCHQLSFFCPVDTRSILRGNMPRSRLETKIFRFRVCSWRKCRRGGGLRWERPFGITSSEE